MLRRPQRADDGEAQQRGAERGQRVPQGGPDLGVGQAVGEGGVQREQRDGDREHRITEGDKSFRIDHDVTAEETQDRVGHQTGTRGDERRSASKGTGGGGAGLLLARLPLRELRSRRARPTRRTEGEVRRHPRRIVPSAIGRLEDGPASLDISIPLPLPRRWSLGRGQDLTPPTRSTHRQDIPIRRFPCLHVLTCLVQTFKFTDHQASTNTLFVHGREPPTISHF